MGNLLDGVCIARRAQLVFPVMNLHDATVVRGAEPSADLLAHAYAPAHTVRHALTNAL